MLTIFRMNYTCFLGWMIYRSKNFFFLTVTVLVMLLKNLLEMSVGT